MARERATINVDVWSDDDFLDLTGADQLFVLTCMALGSSGPCTDARLARRTGWSVEFITARRAAVQHTKFVGCLDGVAKRRKLPERLRQSVFDRDGACMECGAVDNLEVDHIYPVALGGSDDLDNLQALCAPCNRRKGASLGKGVRSAQA